MNNPLIRRSLIMRIRNITITMALVMALAAIGAAQNRGKLTLDLYLDWESVAAPQLSPDGSQIVFTRRWTDKVNDKYESDVWIMNADGSRQRFLVKGSSPQWSPDGRRIAYVAPGQPTGAQIFVKWLDSGEETQLTHLERSPSNLEWSPDGRRIAFNMNVPSKQEFTVRMPQRPAGAKWVDPPRVIDRLDYRSDTVGYRPEGFTHIFVIPDTGGTPRQLTDGNFNHGAPNWTPDSRQLIFSGLRQADAEYQWRESEIYSITLADGQITPLTDRRGPDSSPAVSPDGRRIAYTGFDQTDDTYIVSKLYVMDIDGKNRRVLTDGFDRAPAGLNWASDGNGVYFTTEDRGSDNLYFVALRGGAPQAVTQGVHQLQVTSITKNGMVAGVLSSPTEPGDVVAFSLKNPTPKKLTDVNGDLLEGRKIGAQEEIWYDSVGGKKVQ